MFLWCEANWAYWEVKQQMDQYRNKITDLEARIVKAKEGGGVVRFYNIYFGVKKLQSGTKHTTLKEDSIEGHYQF